MYGIDEIQIILGILVSDCKQLFGDKLVDVRLFGSYARGDHSEHSDIDVMIILNMERSEARKYLSRVCKLASEIDLKYDVVISPVIRSNHDYNMFKERPGFYNNVMREGVSVIAAAG